MRTLFLIPLVHLVFAGEVARSEGPKPRYYFLTDSSESIFKDTCRRRLGGASHVPICREGNGKYDMTFIDEELTQKDWLSQAGGNALTPAQLGSVLVVCDRGTGAVPVIARIFLPAKEESRKGGKDRIELPCGSTPFKANIDMTLAANFEVLKLKNPDKLVASFDQVARACRSVDVKSEACKTAKAIASRAISLEMSLSEAPPVLTIGGLQVAVGLNRPAPTLVGSEKKVPQTFIPPPAEGDLFAMMNWANNRRVSMLSACGWRNYSTQEISELPEYKNLSPERRAEVVALFSPITRSDELFEKAECERQRAAYREYFRKRGIEFDRRGQTLMNGKIVDLGYKSALGSETSAFVDSERAMVEREIKERGTMSLRSTSEQLKEIAKDFVGAHIGGRYIPMINDCLDTDCRIRQDEISWELRRQADELRKTNHDYCAEITAVSVDARQKIQFTFGKCAPQFADPPDEQVRQMWESEWAK